jgi:uncharacterized membrane protein YhaH (DUF805 family)
VQAQKETWRYKNMKLKDKLLSRSAIDRRTYWLYGVLLFWGILFCGSLLDKESGMGLAYWIWNISFTVSFYWGVFLTAKRLEDTAWPWWLIFIPFANVVGLVVALLRGTRPPRDKSKQTAFVDKEGKPYMCSTKLEENLSQ